MDNIWYTTSTLDGIHSVFSNYHNIHYLGIVIKKRLENIIFNSLSYHFSICSSYAPWPIQA